jgi:hypothetical protein
MDSLSTHLFDEALQQLTYIELTKNGHIDPMLVKFVLHDQSVRDRLGIESLESDGDIQKAHLQIMSSIDPAHTAEAALEGILDFIVNVAETVADYSTNIPTKVGQAITGSALLVRFGATWAGGYVIKHDVFMDMIKTTRTLLEYDEYVVKHFPDPSDADAVEEFMYEMGEETNRGRFSVAETHIKFLFNYKDVVSAPTSSWTVANIEQAHHEIDKLYKQLRDSAKRYEFRLDTLRTFIRKHEKDRTYKKTISNIKRVIDNGLKGFVLSSRAIKYLDKKFAAVLKKSQVVPHD